MLFRSLRVTSLLFCAPSRVSILGYFRSDTAESRKERLLDSLSLILVGQPFRPLGAPTPRGLSSSMARDLSLLQASASGQPPDALVLALRILGTFDFSGISGPLGNGNMLKHPQVIL